MTSAVVRAQLAIQLHVTGIVHAVKYRERIFISLASHLACLNEMQAKGLELEALDGLCHGYMREGKFITFEELLRKRLAHENHRL